MERKMSTSYNFLLDRLCSKEKKKKKRSKKKGINCLTKSRKVVPRNLLTVREKEVQE